MTEKRLGSDTAFNSDSTADILRAINQQDRKVADIVKAASPQIAQLVDSIVACMKQGGRLIYIGAGTSGRLGVLDASECPPTFHTDPSQVIGLIAGGDTALRSAVEGAEDDPNGAIAQLDPLDLCERDVVVGIAAGGTTPYVHGGLRWAKSEGATTGFICCVPLQELIETHGRAGSLAEIDLSAIDHLIELPVGPEIVTGSTRMKAGTATKLCLNMISTATMIRLGKTWGDLMVDLRATNAKLRDRAVRILYQQTDLSRDEAQNVLAAADNRVKIALVMARLKIDAEAAADRLEAHQGQLVKLLGPPRA